MFTLSFATYFSHYIVLMSMNSRYVLLWPLLYNDTFLTRAPWGICNRLEHKQAQNAGCIYDRRIKTPQEIAKNSDLTVDKYLAGISSLFCSWDANLLPVSAFDDENARSGQVKMNYSTTVKSLQRLFVSICFKNDWWIRTNLFVLTVSGKLPVYVVKILL